MNIAKIGDCFVMASDDTMSSTFSSDLVPEHCFEDTSDPLYYVSGDLLDTTALVPDLISRFIMSHTAEVFDALRGVFCLVFQKGHHVFVVNDAFGAHPVYYCRPTNNSIVISDNMELVVQYLPKLDLDADFLSSYVLLQGPTLLNITQYKQVKRMPPGCILYADLGTRQISCKRYISFPIADVASQELGSELYEDLYREFEYLFHRNLESILRIYKRPCVFLSGGFDSSSIALGLNTVNKSQTSLNAYFCEFPYDSSADRVYSKLT